MARIMRDPYTFNSSTIGGAGKLGQVYDGVDSTYGRPAKFMLVQHVNAVTVVSGHQAEFVDFAAGTVTNDVTGGASGNGIDVVAGAYVNVPTENYYCYVQVEGYHASLLGDGSVAAGEGISYDATDGVWDTVAAGQPSCGVALTADSGSPTTFEGILMVPHC